MIWGSTFIVIKDSVADFSPFSLIADRFTVASLALGIIIWNKKLNPLKFWKIGLISGVAQFMTFAPQAVGLQITTPSNSAFITGLFVVFTPMINLLFNRNKPNNKELLASIIALIGLWILTGGIQYFNAGDFITILTAIAVSVCLVLTKKALDMGSDPIVLTFQQLFVTAIIGYVCVAITGSQLLPPSANTFLSTLYLGIIATFVAFFVQNSVMKSLDSNVVSIIVSTEPFFALLFSWGFGFEKFAALKLIGGMIMLFAIILPEIKIRSSRYLSRLKFVTFRSDSRHL